MDGRAAFRKRFQSSFHRHVLDKGIAHTYVQPATPQLNGTVELDGIVIDDTGAFNDKLQEWEDHYNYHRPHGALGGQTPYERLKQKTQSTDQTRNQKTQTRL